MTVWPASRNSSIRAATAPWGRARKTASASRGRRRRPGGPRREVGVDARRSGRPAAPARRGRRCVALGWRASSRTSSAPTYPVAPTIATRTGSPSSARRPCGGRRAGRGRGSRGRSAAIAAPVESALTGAPDRSRAAGSRARRTGGTSSPHDYTQPMHSHATHEHAATGCTLRRTTRRESAPGEGEHERRTSGAVERGRLRRRSCCSSPMLGSNAPSTRRRACWSPRQRARRGPPVDDRVIADAVRRPERRGRDHSAADADRPARTASGIRLDHEDGGPRHRGQHRIDEDRDPDSSGRPAIDDVLDPGATCGRSRPASSCSCS